MKRGLLSIIILAWVLLALCATVSASFDSTADSAAQVFTHHFTPRRLASGGGTVWIATRYTCKMDTTQAFNRSDPTQKFVVTCSEQHTWWGAVVLLGMIFLFVTIPMLLAWGKNKYEKYESAREQRRERKRQHRLEEAMRQKLTLQA